MNRRRINLPAVSGALLGALLATCLATAVLAGDDDINRLIGADDIGTGHASAAIDGAPGADGVTGTVGTAGAEDTERWLAAAEPVDALSIITVHPLPGDECQNVLFDMRPSARVRHEASVDETLVLGLSDLCLFGIRNDSDDRSIAIRLGEELRTVAIGIDSRLQAGLTIGPGHEVLTPIRPMSLEEVTFSVEVVWDDLIDSGKAEASAFTVLLTKDPKQES